MPVIKTTGVIRNTYSQMSSGKRLKTGWQHPARMLRNEFLYTNYNGAVKNEPQVRGRHG